MKTINTNCGTIYVENSSNLNVYKKKFKTKKEFERACSNKIIQTIIGENSIKHNKDGSPYINEMPDLNISISHSNNWFSIYLSRIESIGIDLQVFNRKIPTNGDYYINDTETKSIELSNRDIKLIWCIKEAIYKKLQGKVKNFKNDIIVSKIDSEIIHAHYLSKTYKLKHLITDDFYLVYTI